MSILHRRRGSFGGTWKVVTRKPDGSTAETQADYDRAPARLLAKSLAGQNGLHAAAVNVSTGEAWVYHPDPTRPLGWSEEQKNDAWGPALAEDQGPDWILQDHARWWVVCDQKLHYRVRKNDHHRTRQGRCSGPSCPGRIR